MKELKTAGVRLPDSPLVPYPSRSLVPERDVRYTPVLEASRLGIDFGGLTAVDDFTLTIGRTEIAGLIGPNGAGKTTVFNLLTSVYQPTRGSILINGMPTAGKSTHQVSRMGIARTFQNIRLYNDMSVIDNVKVGMHNSVRENLLAAVTHGFGYRKAREFVDKLREEGARVRNREELKAATGLGDVVFKNCNGFISGRGCVA